MGHTITTALTYGTIRLQFKSPRRSRQLPRDALRTDDGYCNKYETVANGLHRITEFDGEIMEKGLACVAGLQSL